MKSPHIHIESPLAFYLLIILNIASIFGRVIPNFLADKTGPLNSTLCILSKISYLDLILSPKTSLGSFCSSDVSRSSLVFLKREILTPKPISAFSMCYNFGPSGILLDCDT